MVTYQELIQLKTSCIDSGYIQDSIKNKIESIRHSLQDFIQKNKERKFPYDKRRIPYKRLKKPDILGRDKLTKDDSIKNNINCDFNKLSPKNFKKLSDRILEVLEKHTDLLIYVIENCFSKATMQPLFCDMYVQFIQLLDEGGFQINEILQEKCNEFNKELTEFKDTSLNNGYTSGIGVTNENYDEFCEQNKKKQFKKGYSQFIASLFSNNLITIKELREMIKQIQHNIEDSKEEPKSSFLEDNITCYIETLDKSCNRDNLDQFAVDIFFCEKMKNIKDLPKRLKFKIMDHQDKIKKIQKG